jgi:ABC-type multidrug transport system permease subunit
VALSALSVVISFIQYHKGGIMVFPLILITASEIVLILGVMSLEWFVVLLFLFCFGLAASNSEIRGWIGWITIILFLTVSVGIAMSKWIIDKYSLYGLIIFTVFSFGQSLYMSFNLVKKGEFTQNEYKDLIYKFWFVMGISSLILTPLFFIDIFKGFVMTFIIGIMISTTLTKPLYSIILEKIVK